MLEGDPVVIFQGCNGLNKRPTEYHYIIYFSIPLPLCVPPDTAFPRSHMQDSVKILNSGRTGFKLISSVFLGKLLNLLELLFLSSVRGKAINS